MGVSSWEGDPQIWLYGTDTDPYFDEEASAKHYTQAISLTRGLGYLGHFSGGSTRSESSPCSDCILGKLAEELSVSGIRKLAEHRGGGSLGVNRALPEGFLATPYSGNRAPAEVYL